MTTNPQTPAPSRTRHWTGWTLSGLLIVFLLFDSLIKLVPIQPVLQTMGDLGYPSTVAFARFLGVVTLLLTLLYALPRTAILGAVLLTGMFGGAIASHLRVDAPLFSHVLFGVYLGVFAWAGLILRRPHLLITLLSGK